MHERPDDDVPRLGALSRPAPSPAELLPRTYAACAACDGISGTPENKAAYAKAIVAYAEEMVPTILDFLGQGHGEWQQSRDYGYNMPSQLDWKARNGRWQFVHELFDHLIILRLRGARGRATWRNTFLIGQPYRNSHLIDQDGRPGRDAYRMAALGFQTSPGTGVWMAPDPSAWRPGCTCLVLAGPLSVEEASYFGFASLVDMNARD